MAIKATDKFVITGKELPITIELPDGSIRYEKAGEVLIASDWPSWKKTIDDALICGLISPATFSNIVEDVVVDEEPIIVDLEEVDE